MRCRAALTRIDALRTGELEPAEERAVREHLRSCSSCSASLSDLEELAGAMRKLVVAPSRSAREVVSGADSYGRVGDYWVAFSAVGVRLIARGSAEEFRAVYARRYGRALGRAPLPARLVREVEAAIAGEGIPKPHVDLADASDLERGVLVALTRIPRGEVRSYSWLARQAGRPRAVRAVASILARNHAPFLLPCHRVVPAAGGVGDYMFGSRKKRELLEREGVDVAQLEALARRGVRFIGSKTTNIFCFPTCRDARRIREENRVPFHGEAEATQRGFRPCRHCQPAAA